MHGFRLPVFLAGRFGIVHHFGGVFFHFQQVESAYESYAVLFQSDVFRHPIPKHPTIVGEHEIIFAGQDEVIELKHTAYSRAIFGKGAVSAALYLAGKEAGMYDMSDVIG